MYRTFALVAVLLVLTAVGASAQGMTGTLAGTWELIEQRLIYPDGRVVDRSDSLQHTIKILNDTRFSFGRQIRDGEIYGGGGTYDFDGTSYTEHIRYHSEPGLPGQSLTFEARVDGDTWYHRGDIGPYVVDEVYRRID